MKDQSIDGEISELVENYESEFVRLWSRNELGNAAGVVARRGESDSRFTPEEFDFDELKLEYLTVPLPETFRLLPVEDQALVGGPDGLMFCDVYERVGGEFLKLAEGAEVTDTAEVMGGVTGLGVEFFYTAETDRTIPSGWGCSVPSYRDYMTPSIPDLTLQALLNLGTGRDDEGSAGRRNGSSRTFRPKLRSTL